MNKYPRLGQDKRRPRDDVEGVHNVGKPCIVCGKFTIGIKWIQVSYMRGDDEEVRVCSDHWKKSAPQIIQAYIDSLPLEGL